MRCEYLILFDDRYAIGNCKQSICKHAWSATNFKNMRYVSIVWEIAGNAIDNPIIDQKVLIKIRVSVRACTANQLIWVARAVRLFNWRVWLVHCPRLSGNAGKRLVFVCVMLAATVFLVGGQTLDI